MTGTLPEPTGRERALATVDQIRDALTNDDLQAAVDKIDQLQTQLADWKRREARQWLDEALRADLLLFNQDAAKKRLQQWADAITDPDNAELASYRERVDKRAQQKQADLQARGVSAHCTELWDEAARLEAGDNPPKPGFALTQFYAKARDVVAAAVSEHPNNATLSVLFQRAERLHDEKTKADTIYKIAIENDRYADALDLLDSMDVVTLIPAYRVVVEANSPDLLRFDRMLPIFEAREEITKRGQMWSTERAEEMRVQANTLLDQYQPQAALDALGDRKLVSRFVSEKINQALRDLETRASTDLRLLEQAERRARQAQRLAADNALGAWELLVEAYETYAGATALAEARQTIVGAMVERLQGLVREAEAAFNQKRMDRIQRIYQGARLDYADKDETLDEWLAHLAEFDRQARAYEDYRRNAQGLLERIRQVMWEDAAAAGELLSELDGYPPIVLDDLDGLADVRADVRRRLNMEVVYNQLRGLLASKTIAEIETGIQSAAPYADEDRFARLLDWLDVHRAYLEARAAYDAGDDTQALALLDEVAQFDDHPDQNDAQSLAAQIRQKRANDAGDMG